MTIVSAKEAGVTGEEKIASRSERHEESDIHLPLEKRLLHAAGKNFVKTKLEVMSSDSQLAIRRDTQSVNVSDGTRIACPAKILPKPGSIRLLRSEEHTSELQSLTNLVCRLLLEKKKKKRKSTAEKHQSHNCMPLLSLRHTAWTSQL